MQESVFDMQIKLRTDCRVFILAVSVLLVRALFFLFALYLFFHFQELTSVLTDEHRMFSSGVSVGVERAFRTCNTFICSAAQMDSLVFCPAPRPLLRHPSAVHCYKPAREYAKN